MLKLTRVCYIIHQLPHLMVLKNAIHHFLIYDQSRVHCSVRCFARCYLHFAISDRTPRKWFPSPYNGPPKVSCNIFEDNTGALELANNPKLRPWTKRIAIPYHHFWHHVNAGTIIIEKVASKEILADIFYQTPPLSHLLVPSVQVVGMVGLCEGVLEYASNAEAWPAHTPALSMYHMHQLTHHCFSTDIILPLFRSYDRSLVSQCIRNMPPIAQW